MIMKVILNDIIDLDATRSMFFECPVVIFFNKTVF
jgi:hypothetical protein